MKIDELKAAVQAETVEIDHLVGAVTDEEARINEIIQALKDAKTGTPDADLDPVIADLVTHAANMRAIREGVAAFQPAPPVTPPAV